jgi:hypothetical protein
MIDSRNAISSRRKGLARFLTLAAVFLMVLSGYQFRWRLGFPLSEFAVIFMLLGGLALGSAIWLGRQKVTLLTPAKSAPIESRPRWIPLLLGGWALILLADINAGWSGLHTETSQHEQMILFVAGVALVTWGLVGRVRWPRWRAKQAWPLLAIMLLGFIVRAWELDTAVHIWIDEVHFVNAILRLGEVPETRLLIPFDPLAAFTSVYPYAQSRLVDILGPDLLALRLLSLVLGTLTIPALYLLAKALFDRPTALLAALLLAAYPPHVHFSRSGLNNIADPLFGVLALAFLARGLQHNRRRDYALAGVSLGLTHYFYEGGRLLFTPLLIGWLGLALLIWRPRIHWRQMLVMGLAFVLVALPVYATLSQPDFSLTSRLDSTGDRNQLVQALQAPDPGAALRYFFERQIIPAMLHFVRTPDGSQFFYGGSTGLILWYVVPLFFLGLFQSLWRLRLPGVLLLAWIGLTVLGNSLLHAPDWSARFVVALPAIALLLALGLRHTVLGLVPSDFPLRQRNLLITGVALVLAVSQLIYYFGPHLEIYNVNVRTVQGIPVKDHHDALYRALEYPPGSSMYYITDDPVYWPHIVTLLRFWDYDLHAVHWLPDDLSPELIEQMPEDETLLFFIESGDQETLTALQDRFTLDGPHFSPYPTVPANRQYALYVVER